MKIGELARRSSTLAVTIRYYEQSGILPPPPRSRNGYREYDGDHLRRLRFVRRCRDLGFSVQEIHRLIRLTKRRTQSCRAVSRLAEEQLTAVRTKLDELRRLERVLAALTSSCSNGTVETCRILEALDPAGSRD